MTYSDHDLKEYLMRDYKDKVHPGLCLVEIYLQDPKYFSELVKQRKISAKAATFCAMYDKQIQALRDVTVDAFMKLKLSFLINEFLNNTDGVDRITWETFDQYKKEHSSNKEKKKIINQGNSQNNKSQSNKSDTTLLTKKQKKALKKLERRKKRIKQRREILQEEGRVYARISKYIYKCPFDNQQLKYCSMKSERDFYGNIHVYPIFYCSKCGRFYTSTEGREGETVYFQRSKHGISLINVLPYEKKTIHVDKPQISDNKNRSLAASPTMLDSVNDLQVSVDKLKTNTGNTGSTTSYTRNDLICPDSHHKLNCFCYENELPNHCWTAGCNNHSISEKTVKIQVSGKPYLVNKCPDCGVYYIKKGLYDLYPEYFNFIDHQELAQIRKAGDEPKEVNIRTQEVKRVDVIVKGNTFQCVHKGHYIETIRAQVPIILKNGWIISTTVPAGYCRSCGTYFIRENTFKSLQSRGIIACCVKTENAYYHGEHDNSYSNFADESPLMEFGYNVSATSNLSSEARQSILSLMIDHGIMSKSSIIDYLQLFISQRNKQKKKDYSAAIEKWEDDISFVQSYKAKNARTVKAGSIKYKRH